MMITPKPDLAALRASLRGVAWVPGDPQFGAACQGFNLAVAHSPDVIVGATSTADVVSAVRYAERVGMTVSVQSTGHGIGVPAADGMLITTSHMRSLSIDPEAGTACAGAGIIWRDVIEAAAPHGLAPLNGSSVTVGVVGYMLGGGRGPMGRTIDLS